MEKIWPRYDIDFWNLDGLTLREQFEGKGEMKILPVEGGLEAVKRVRVLYDSKSNKQSILILRSEWGVVQELNPDSKSVRPVLIFKDKDFSEAANLDVVDMATFGGGVYLLNKRHNRIHHLNMVKGKLQPAGSWQIDSDYILEISQIEVASHNGQLMAYVGPCRNGVFLVIKLSTPIQMNVLEIKLPEKMGSLGRELSFCVDELNYSLVVADIMHHRIVEVDCDSGIAKIICGTGEKGNSQKEEIGKLARLDLPRSVAIYRPGKYVTTGKLSEQSRTFLDLSANGRKPRIIFIADSGNYSIKKLVELSFPVADLLSLPAEPILYNFIGSGKKQKGDLRPLEHKSRNDLRNYSILKPFDLFVSELGELFIICPSSMFLILLRPATASADRAVKEVGSYEHNEDT